MSAPQQLDPPPPASRDDEPQHAHRNEVLLVGRLAAAPMTRELPSGDLVVLCRLVVSRPAVRSPRRIARATSLDTIDCAAWSGAARRTVTAWHAGDLVQVTGALRRRFWRTAAGAASRYEVEVARGRRLSRGR